MDLAQALSQFSSVDFGWQLVILLFALLFVAMFALVFWMAGALASDDRITFVGSLLYGSAQFFVLLGAGFGAFSLVAGSDMNAWISGRSLLLGGGLTLAIDLALILGLVLLVVKGTVGEGLFIWLIRLPLLALLSALTAGMVFVGLATYQASREPDGEKILLIVGLVLLGVAALGIGIFFATRYSGPTIVRRPGS